MEKMKQVLKLEIDTGKRPGTYIVVRKLGEVNPFHLYYKWAEIKQVDDRGSILIKHRNLVERYANLEGCIYHLMQIPEIKRELARDVW